MRIVEETVTEGNLQGMAVGMSEEQLELSKQQKEPLTLALSPQSRGEGTRPATLRIGVSIMVAKSVVRTPSSGLRFSNPDSD